MKQNNLKKKCSLSTAAKCLSLSQPFVRSWTTIATSDYHKNKACILNTVSGKGHICLRGLWDLYCPICLLPRALGVGIKECPKTNQDENYPHQLKFRYHRCVVKGRLKTNSSVRQQHVIIQGCYLLKQRFHILPGVVARRWSIRIFY